MLIMLALTALLLVYDFFIENVVKYTNVMQYVKENVADIIILILLAVWGKYMRCL